jgi:hypothetical protein
MPIFSMPDAPHMPPRRQHATLVAILSAVICRHRRYAATVYAVADAPYACRATQAYASPLMPFTTPFVEYHLRYSA